MCGAGSRGFGSIAVSVDNHVGFAEGIVHETAHHKLRALGVDIESATRLILNPPERTYPSPIRYDCLRPMSAVLHAQYSYTYIMQLDLHILRAQECPERDRQIVEDSLAVILPKLEFGMTVLKSHLVADMCGEAFFGGLETWTREILDDGQRLLDQYNVSVQPFRHPMADARA
jgi:HEXXH motif-containing protein